jgi:hypothetical protein
MCHNIKQNCFYGTNIKRFYRSFLFIATVYDGEGKKPVDLQSQFFQPFLFPFSTFFAAS